MGLAQDPFFGPRDLNGSGSWTTSIPTRGPGTQPISKVQILSNFLEPSPFSKVVPHQKLGFFSLHLCWRRAEKRTVVVVLPIEVNMRRHGIVHMLLQGTIQPCLPLSSSQVTLQPLFYHPLKSARTPTSTTLRHASIPLFPLSLHECLIFLVDWWILLMGFLFLYSIWTVFSPSLLFWSFCLVDLWFPWRFDEFCWWAFGIMCNLSFWYHQI